MNILVGIPKKIEDKSSVSFRIIQSISSFSVTITSLYKIITTRLIIHLNKDKRCPQDLRKSAKKSHLFHLLRKFISYINHLRNTIYWDNYNIKGYLFLKYIAKNIKICEKVMIQGLSKCVVEYHMILNSCHFRTCSINKPNTSHLF